MKPLWLAGSESLTFPPRACDVNVDVAIVGGGITGLTAALHLLKNGKQVALIDKGKIGQGESGHTTAHLTEILDIRYSEIVARFGLEKAQLVQRSSRAAIERIHTIAREFRIPCSFERVPGYLFTQEESEVEGLKRETDVLNRLGMRATFSTKSPLPFPVKGCIEIENQAQFHPYDYLLGLASTVAREGGHIFEDTHALEFSEGSPARVITDNGVLVADQVIIAANVPISNRLLIQTKLAAYRSYAIAVRTNSPTTVKGLFWDTKDPYHYLRTQVVEAKGKTSEELLIIGGEDHKTGMDHHPEDHYTRLEKFARDHFDVKSVPYRWSGQIIEPVDGLPYVGLNAFSENYYVATGYSGNGMTMGTMAGILLTDLISGMENPWAALYDATRIHLTGSFSNFVKENKDFPACLLHDRLTRAPVVNLASIKKNEGGIIKVNGETVAANRDSEGNLKFFSPACPHMGCHVQWNGSESSWDCPCHGSRFDEEGQVLNGPAISALKEISASELFESEKNKGRTERKPATPSPEPSLGLLS